MATGTLITTSAIQDLLVHLPTADVPTFGDLGLSELGPVHDLHLAAGRLHSPGDPARGVSALRTSAEREIHHAHSPGPRAQAQLDKGCHHLGVRRGAIFVAAIVHTDVGLDDDIMAALDEPFNAPQGRQGRPGNRPGLLTSGHSQVGLIRRRE